MVKEGYSIRNVNQALKLFLKISRRKGLHPVRAIPQNFNRHRLVICRYRTREFAELVGADPREREVKLYLAFQRQWFHSFEKFFGVPEEACTLNKRIVLFCIKEGVDYIVFAHGSGGFYLIDPKDMYGLATENGWIRTTKKTGEEVIHVPIHYLHEIKT